VEFTHIVNIAYSAWNLYVFPWAIAICALLNLRISERYSISPYLGL